MWTAFILEGLTRITILGAVICIAITSGTPTSRKGALYGSACRRQGGCYGE